MELCLDGLDAGGPLDFNLLGILPEFLLYTYIGWIFAIPLVGCFAMFYIMVGQEIGSVVVHELAMVVKGDLWGFCEVWVVCVA